MPDESELDALLDIPGVTKGVEEEIPPTPHEAELLHQPSLHERRAAAMKRMLADPERKKAYDAATEEIMSHPAVKSLAAAEAHHAEKMEHYRVEFMKAWKKAKA